MKSLVSHSHIRKYAIIGFKTPFSAHSSPKDPLIFFCHPKNPCLCEFFDKKKYKFVTQWPHFFHFFEKKSELFDKFPSRFVTKHVLFGISSPKDPFLCKISFFTRRPLFLWFLPHRMPLTLKIGTSASALYSSVPRSIFSFVNSCFHGNYFSFDRLDLLVLCG